MLVRARWSRDTFNRKTSRPRTASGREPMPLTGVESPVLSRRNDHLRRSRRPQPFVHRAPCCSRCADLAGRQPGHGQGRDSCRAPYACRDLGGYPGVGSVDRGTGRQLERGGGGTRSCPLLGRHDVAQAVIVDAGGQGSGATCAARAWVAASPRHASGPPGSRRAKPTDVGALAPCASSRGHMDLVTRGPETYRARRQRAMARLGDVGCGRCWGCRRRGRRRDSRRCAPARTDRNALRQRRRQQGVKALRIADRGPGA